MQTPRFRTLAAVTTAMTFILILLGVYTAAMGAGLACAGRWPFCDGWMGLFPATLPSFIEWFHRLWAMVTGFLILGTAIEAWRTDQSQRVRRMAASALVLTPVQFLLGAATVFSYRPLSQVAHHGTAMLIFGALLAVTLWTWDGPTGVEPTTDPHGQHG